MSGDQTRMDAVGEALNTSGTRFSRPCSVGLFRSNSTFGSGVAAPRLKLYDVRSVRPTPVQLRRGRRYIVCEVALCALRAWITRRIRMTGDGQSDLRRRESV